MNIKGVHILVDRACGGQEICSYIIAQDAEYVISSEQNPKSPWHIDWFLYKERFNTIKQFRRIATRYDKIAASFLAFVTLLSNYIPTTWKMLRSNE